jgi:hypothetical protein
MSASGEIPRRSLEEISLRCQLEPSLKDVFVEGDFDLALLRWFIASTKDLERSEDVNVYKIDDVDLTDEVLERHELKRGNKSEVIALCLEMDRILGSDSLSVTGIVDRDAEEVLGESHNTQSLLRSDDSCIEMCLFRREVIAKATALAFPGFKLDYSAVVRALSPVLRKLFLYRTAAMQLGWGLRWKKPDSFVVAKKDSITFREADFKRHYLQESGYIGQVDLFDRTVCELEARLSDAMHSHANGHDAIFLFGLLLRSHCKKQPDMDKTHPHVLVHILTCCLETDVFGKTQMATALLDRLGRKSA